MSQFIFTYHGGNKPETSEEGQMAMETWKEWAAGLGSALINPGTPVGITKVLTANGALEEPSPHPIMGFSIIEAENLDGALELLKDCPHLHIFKGTLDVSEMLQMP